MAWLSDFKNRIKKETVLLLPYEGLKLDARCVFKIDKVQTLIQTCLSTTTLFRYKVLIIHNNHTACIHI